LAIRILVVDDSVVIRKLLTDALSADPALEVVGTARDGRVALAKVDALDPDLVTLDIEMPVMNGLEALAELRKTHPRLPVIMFSTLTERGATATLEALTLGATDYATKPSNTGSMNLATEAIHNELIPKIKALCGASPRFVPPVQTPPPIKPTLRSNQQIEVVAIGTSTGGPNALAEVLPRLPKHFPVPVVVVQHMPAIFTRLLAERLATQSAIPVEEGRAGAKLVPGHAWIAPGNFHMKVLRAGAEWHLSLNQSPPENFCRPAVDVMFRSVAQAFGPNVLGVVMTGMGSDGMLGARAIRDAGGSILVQDEASSVVWGMPGLIYASGLADAVYPLEQLAMEITRRVLQSSSLQSRAVSTRCANPLQLPEK
jgi:two-component system chemotaxis response regulator CheB